MSRDEMRDPGAGPRLSDADFFGGCLDVARPSMRDVASAADRQDFATARRIFAVAVRGELQPEKYLALPRQPLPPTALAPDESIAGAAERIVRGELISCSRPHPFPGEIDWTLDPTPEGYREWTMQLNRHPEWSILALRYRETGDERFADSFVRMFLGWVRRVLVPIDRPGNETTTWRTIEAGIRMGAHWPTAIHAFLASPVLTDDVLVDWCKSVWEHGRRLWRSHRARNWLIMEMNGLAQIGILYPMLSHAQQWREYALERLAAELECQVHPDGVHGELSTNYHQVVVRNYEQVRDVADAYGVSWPEVFDPWLESMHSVNLGLMQPDGSLPDLNDGRQRPVAPLLHRAVARYPHRADLRWAHTEGRDGRPPAWTSVAFPHAGYYVMRTGWGQEAVWGLFDGGPFGLAHQHEDKLNLLVHAYGQPMLVEAGNYAYDASPMRTYVRSTRAHNTIRVDGQDQNRAQHFDRDAVDLQVTSRAQWASSARVDAVEATYDEGYGTNGSPTVRHTRRVFLIKAGFETLGPMFLVVDRLLPEDDALHTYEILWHLRGRVQAEGLVVAGTSRGTARLAVASSAVDGMTVRVVAGQREPEWQGWVSVGTHQQGEYAPIPTAIYDVAAAGPLRVVTVLYPSPPGAPCAVRGVCASTDVADTAVQIATATGEWLRLDEETLLSERALHS
ncbi:alginate lyase family protein [Ruania alba]|uniref:alginate lyase family protein n=1 Tax=Ruania alba TaxID=648782 RepID=UPI00158705BA|nr:alginate lyase family protein [Ruania alba]